jgi:hypothetical protein
MRVDRGPLGVAKEIASKELKKIKQDPEEVFKSIEEGLTKFIETGDKSFWKDFLDTPENEKVADILTEQRDELGNSVLGEYRKALEQRKKDRL